MVTPIKANVIRSARPPQASRKHFAAAGNAQGGFPFRAPKRNSKLFGTCASVYARHNVRSVLDIDWFNNAQTGGSIVKKSKRRSKAVLPALGVTGLSLSLASGATASTGEATVASTSQPHELLLGEEEVFDTSLSTFYTFDKENGGQTSLAQHLKLARGGGCGGCGCGHGGGCGGGCAARGCGGGGGCAARGCAAGVRCAGVGVRCAGVGVHCRCAFFRRCFGCGCSGCGGCGGWGCGTCWIWTPAWGWVNTCWGESTHPAKVSSVASEPVAQIAEAEEKR